jgi:hypothetical protein
MFKNIMLVIALLVLVTLSGCEEKAIVTNDDLGKVSKELEGCKAFEVYFSDGAMSRVIRCPSMDTISTNYASGKSRRSTTVLSDQEDKDAKVKQIEEGIENLRKQLDELKK